MSDIKKFSWELFSMLNDIEKGNWLLSTTGLCLSIAEGMGTWECAAASVENSLLMTVNLLDGWTGVYSDGRVRGTKAGDDQEG